MKRYVKEIHSDLVSQLITLGCNRNKEYLDSRLQLDKILRMAEKYELTDKDAVSAMITEYDKAFYEL